MENNTTLIEGPKARMLKNIERLWGIKNTDEIDPLVKILVDALAGEVYKINQEISTFDTRILEKLALLLTPVLLSLPSCAHTIVHAIPNEFVEVISSKTRLSYATKQQASNSLKYIYFTPVLDTQIIFAQIQYIYANNSLFECKGCEKSLKSKGEAIVNSSNELWIGIDVHSDIDFLNCMCFYFQLKNLKFNKQFFSVLNDSSWYFNDVQINTKQGFSTKEIKQKGEALKKQDPMHILEQDICNFYQEQFLTIDDASLNSIDIETMKVCYPKAFVNLFSSSELAKLKEPLIWFNIKSPLPIPEDVFNDLSVHLNAFPVMNRQLKECTHRMRGITNIIPIRTDMNDFFLSMESVTDSLDKHYHSIPYSDGHTSANDCYVLRKGGTERMDSRSAKEYLQHVLNVMKDEASAFAGYGTDAISTLLKDMDRLIAQLEQRLAKSTQLHMDHSYYISLPQQRNEEVFFLSYWLTNGLLANGIHAGAQLTEAKGSKLKKGSIYLLTPSIGGKAVLEERNQIDAFKYSLLTHDRIVTAEDIKAFCRLEFGNRIASEIVIRRALTVSENPKEGLVRCVEVLLKPSELNARSDLDWDTELKLVQTKLEGRSSLNLRIRLILAV